MKKVVFINPNYASHQSAIDRYHLSVQRYPPLGLAYLAAFLRKNGFKVEIIDAAVLDLTDEVVVKILKRKKPYLIGLYVVSFSLPAIYSLIRKIKSQTNCLVMVGGPHITHQPQSVFKLGADYGIAGEGELALVDFLKSKNKKQIAGLIYKDQKNWRINRPQLIKDLDILPFPARDLLPNDRYYSPLFGGKTTTMVTSRGCVYNCIFCGLPTGRVYRKRSVKNIIQELEKLIKDSFQYLEIQDDFFTFDHQKVKEICRFLIERKTNLRWGCETRADFVDEKILSLMKKAGCYNVNFGVEAGSERVRNKIIGKNLSSRAILKAVKAAKKVGLKTVAYFIFGHPTETLVEMKKTLKFARELKPNYAEFHLSIPIPGSRLFTIACREKKIEEDIWDKVIFGKEIPIYIPDNIKLEQMIHLQKKAYSRFYFSLPKLIENIKDVRSLKDFRLKLQAGLMILRNRSL